jgi:hypothetical protein
MIQQGEHRIKGWLSVWWRWDAGHRGELKEGPVEVPADESVDDGLPSVIRAALSLMRTAPNHICLVEIELERPTDEPDHTTREVIASWKRRRGQWVSCIA